MSESNVAQDQIKAYVDRILRMKDEADAIAQDIREIYAEAKGNGFDKTQLGNLVTYLRKKDKDAEKLAENEAIFDLYLEAYLGASGKVGTKRATHTYAPEAPDALAALRANPAMSIVDASNLKTKSQTQPAPQAGSDLTIPPSPQGQVATHPEPQEPEAATSPAQMPAVDAVHVVPAESGVIASPPGAEGIADREPIQPEAAAPSAEPERASAEDGWEDSPVLTNSEPAREGGSQSQEAAGPGLDDAAPSSGEAWNSDVSAAVDTQEGAAGSTVPAAPMYAAPGVVTWETMPPEPVKRHDFSYAFGDLGQDLVVIGDDIASAKAEPIVKIGNEILDGWARYMVARGAIGLDGQSTEYPVVQYDGADPLMDCIKWNLAGRILNDAQKRLIAQRLAKLQPKRKADIYAAMEMGMELVA